MKLSVIRAPSGDIVGAVIADAVRHAKAGSHASSDELRLPAGHTRHDMDMPDELVRALKEGNISEGMERYFATKPR